MILSALFSTLGRMLILVSLQQPQWFENASIYHYVWRAEESLPHLDYDDVLYHNPANVCEFSNNIILPHLMEKIESVQYSAALDVTGAWRGSSREKLYVELGWESLLPEMEYALLYSTT